MKTSEFITKALNNFKRYKWIKGRRSDALASPNGGCCLLGMTDKVKGRKEHEQQEVFRLVRAITGAYSIAEWNDKPERTRQEVMGALKVARELAIKQELGE